MFVNLMEDLRKVLRELLPSMLMVVYQLSTSGAIILSNLVANAGMNPIILNAYRFLVSNVVLLIVSLIFERNNKSKITRKVLFLAFGAALIGGVMGQGLLLESLALTSPTIVTAMTNLIPAIMFVLALLFRMEKLELGTIAGKAKVCGTLIAVGGAMVLTFYKDVKLELWSTHVDLLHKTRQKLRPSQTHRSKNNNILGPIVAFLSSVFQALWLLVQTKLLKEYPRPCMGATLMTIMASILCLIVAFCTERNWSQWKLHFDIRLLTIVYMGTMHTALSVPLMTSVSKMRGPIFVSIFNPLSLVIIAILGSLILGEKISLGSVIGAILIALGIYMVLWGKGKTSKEQNEVLPKDFAAESPCSIKTEVLPR